MHVDVRKSKEKKCQYVFQTKVHPQTDQPAFDGNNVRKVVMIFAIIWVDVQILFFSRWPYF